jgi:hypothetical protein
VEGPRVGEHEGAGEVETVEVLGEGPNLPHTHGREGERGQGGRGGRERLSSDCSSSWWGC